MRKPPQSRHLRACRQARSRRIRHRIPGVGRQLRPPDAGGTARFLDNPVTRAAASEDPVRFVRQDRLMLIDEVQCVPDLWLAIKDTVDRDPRPGRFLLTDSARLRPRSADYSTPAGSPTT
jgi:hypothetical protein